MGAEFTFYDYVDHQGRNLVDSWLQADVTKMVKEKFNEQLTYLEATPIGMWDRPYAAPVGDSLFEIRVVNFGQHYRILGTHTPGGKPTLLECFVKRDKKIPPENRTRAIGRREDVLADPIHRRTEHSYE